MATFSTLSANNNNYTLRLEVAENSTDVASNTSAVSWALYIDSTYARFEDYTVAADVVLDGVTVYRDTAYRSMPDTRRESLLLGSGTAGIAHNGDGGKTLNVSYSIAMPLVMPHDKPVKPVRKARVIGPNPPLRTWYSTTMGSKPI